MKKAQLFEQPLFYIFVLIVAALFLAFGIKTMFNLKEKAELIELATSIQDIKDKVGKYYSFDYGSSTELDIRVPPKIEYICFTNHDPKEIPLKNYGDLQKLFTLSKYNLFIFPVISFKENAFTVPYLTSKEDPLCIQTKGSLKAIITNIGTSVEISKAI